MKHTLMMPGGCVLPFLPIFIRIAYHAHRWRRVLTGSGIECLFQAA